MKLLYSPNSPYVRKSCILATSAVSIRSSRSCRPQPPGAANKDLDKQNPLANCRR